MSVEIMISEYPTEKMQELYEKYHETTKESIKQNLVRQMKYEYLLRKTLDIKPRLDTYITDTWNYLRTMRPDLMLVDMDWENGLVVGPCQGGKTSFILSIVLMKILSGKPCIMILRNSSKDAIQIRNKVARFSKEHVEFMTKKGYKKCPSLEVVLVGDISSGRLSEEDSDELPPLKNYGQVLDALTGTHKRLVLGIGNGFQLQHLNRVMNEYIDPDFSDFVLFTDEADSVGYSEMKFPDIPEYHAAYEYQVLYTRASQKFEVSATVFDILVGNSNLPCHNIAVIRPPPSYKGIRDGVQFSAFAMPVEHWKEGTIHVDPNIRFVYEELGEIKPYTEKRYNVAGFAHPVICLHKTQRTRAHHDAFLWEFQTDPTTRDLWTVVLEDGRGVKIYSKSLSFDTMTLSGETLVDSTGSGLFIFTKDNIDIQEVLQWFYDNGGCKRFHHIVIKSGDLAGRSRSYVSTNGKYHLTHQYFVPSKKDTIPNMIQACRLNHDRPDSIPLMMYAPEQVIIDLQRGALMQEEQLNRLKEVQCNSLTFDHVRQEIWSRCKVPKARLCNSRLNRDYKPIKIEGNDNGWSTEVYEIQENMVETVACIDSDDDEEDTGVIPPDEFSRLEILFNKWSKSDTKIARFMRELDPEKFYTAADIKKSGLDVNNMLGTRDSSKHNCYGMILEKIGNGRYRLYRELVPLFLEIFSE